MSEESNLPWVPVGEALKKIAANDTGPKRDFLILGAGIAGLAAALELQGRGHKVRILEGSDRVGGRIYTRTFKPGSFGELGAMRVPANHDYTHHYIVRAGLQPAKDLFRFWNLQANGYVDARGQVERWMTLPQILKAFPNLTPAEKAVVTGGKAPWEGVGNLLGLYMKPLVDSLTAADRQKLLAADFSDPKLRQLDQISWFHHLRYATNPKASTDGLELLGRVLSLDALWHWSLAAVLRDELHKPGEAGGILWAIRDGMSRLPEGLYGKLPKGTVELGCEILGIEKDSKGGRVLYRKDGKVVTESFNRLLCTLPVPVLRQLDLKGFSPEKQLALRNFRYTNSAKVVLAYDQRWWEGGAKPLTGGRSSSDRMIRETYYPSDSLPPAGSPAEDAAREADDDRLLFRLYTGESPEEQARLEALAAAAPADAAAKPGTLLASYSHNERTRQLARLPEKERVPAVLADLRRFHKEDALEHFKASQVHVWDEHPWARGAFAMTPPGDLVSYYADLARNEGTVYFAGEHVSIAPGWIQGALESSLREVARMVKEA